MFLFVSKRAAVGRLPFMTLFVPGYVWRVSPTSLSRSADVIEITAQTCVA
jgi:hypothetical protein